MMTDSGQKLKVALTGGIGSGKSYVCQVLREFGIEVYDCDAAAKRLMQTDEEVISRLTEVVGGNTYVDGKLNKAVVAKYLLASESNKEMVNGIVHPAVARDFLSSGLTWLESAILFDCGFQRYVDRVVCVTAPREVRVRRVMQRDGISRQHTLEWMNKQMDQRLVRKLADYEIVNDGKKDLRSQVKSVLVSLGYDENNFSKEI